jgi:flagellar basal-body rod protein FlgC
MSDVYEIAASGMSAQRTQMDLIAQNLANAGLPRADGSFYQPKVAVFAPAGAIESSFDSAFGEALDGALSDVALDGEQPVQPAGVEVAAIVDRPGAVQYRFDPGNPFAATSGAHKGYVALGDVDPIAQMADLISTGRAYDADVSVLSAAKLMDAEAADIGRA